MSPLCIWTVHMSQGFHVWSLHGSISCIIKIIFTFTYWEKMKSRLFKPFWIMSAIWKTSVWTTNTLSLSQYHRADILVKCPGNGLQVFLESECRSHHFQVIPNLTHTAPVEMDHSSLISLCSTLWVPISTLQSTFTQDLHSALSLWQITFFTRGVLIIEVCHQLCVAVNREVGHCKV